LLLDGGEQDFFQGLTLPSELRLGNGLPAAEAHGHLGRSSNRVVVVSPRFIRNDFQQVPQPAPQDRTDSLERAEIDRQLIALREIEAGKVGLEMLNRGQA